jgi:hypothetical protein
MNDLAIQTVWKPPPSVLKVGLTIGVVLAALTVLAVVGWLPVPAAVGAGLIFGSLGVDCYRRGER